MECDIEKSLQKLDASVLRKKGLLTVHDLSNVELEALLDLSDGLKAKKKAGILKPLVPGKNVAMVFEKMSTRTRSATAVAVADEGGSTEYLATGDIHLGKKESVKDTARVLGRMFDGIMFRGFAHRTVELLAEYAGIPVWNALTDMAHPSQTLADLMTIREKFGHLKGLRVAYVGDGRNNVANSLMAGCVKMGIHFVNCTPKELSPCSDLVKRAEDIASQTGGSVTISHDPMAVMEGVHVIYTDVWVSMGEESQQDVRMQLLRPYQVTMEMLRKTGHMDSDKVIFLHCLPAFHDSETEVTRDIGALEVTDDVFESSFSRVFDQAENRMHTIKAMVVSSLRPPA